MTMKCLKLENTDITLSQIMLKVTKTLASAVHFAWEENLFLQRKIKPQITHEKTPDPPH